MVSRTGYKGNFTVASLENISATETMALSPNGTPWFAEFASGKIGKVNLGAPITLKFSFQNFTNNKSLSLGPNNNVTLGLNVLGPLNETVSLSLYLSTYDFSAPYVFQTSQDSNTTKPAFLYSFSSASGVGNFSSDLSLADQHLAPGLYYLTVSAQTTDIIISNVISVKIGSGWISNEG
jgi:hypothetical protein